MRILRWIGIAVLALLVGLGVTALAARWHDGPLGLFPGGPLEGGALVEEPVADWSFAADVETIELQLVAQERSRTVWIAVADGRAWVPASLAFPPGKTWHRMADEDGRALLRIQGRRYPVTLERLEDEAAIAAAAEAVGAKYGAGPPGDAGVWFFRVTSRTP